MYRAELGIGDAFGQLITFAVVSGIYSLIILFITIFMKMEAKDRLVIFITSFITMMDICFFAFSMMYMNSKIATILTFLVILILPIIIGGLVYNNILVYKRMKGVWVAIITHGTLLAIDIILSASYYITVLSRIKSVLNGI